MGPPIFTDDEAKKMRILYEQGYSDAEIARRVFVSSGTVLRWRRELNLPPNLPKRGRPKKPVIPTIGCSPKPTIEETAIAARKAGKTYGEYTAAPVDVDIPPGLLTWWRRKAIIEAIGGLKK